MANFIECKLVAIGTEEKTKLLFRSMLENYSASYDENDDVDDLLEKIHNCANEKWCDDEFEMEMIYEDPEGCIYSDWSRLDVEKYKDYYITTFRWADRSFKYVEDFQELHMKTGIYMKSIHTDGGNNYGKAIIDYYDDEWDGDYDCFEEIDFVLRCANMEPQPEVTLEFFDEWDITENPEDKFFFYVPKGEKAPSLEKELEDYDWVDEDEEDVEDNFFDDDFERDKLSAMADYYLFEIAYSEKMSRIIDKAAEAMNN